MEKTENVGNFLVVSSKILVPCNLHVLLPSASYNTNTNDWISDQKSISQWSCGSADVGIAEVLLRTVMTNQ
jgi:hypothetical protein